MKSTLIIPCAFLLIIVANAQSSQPAPSQPPNPVMMRPQHQESPDTKQKPNNHTTNLEKSVPIREIINADDSQNKAKAKYTKGQNSWPSWIAIAAIFIALLQTIALFITYWMMRSSARRQLRAYVFVENISISNVIKDPLPGMQLQRPIDLWTDFPTGGPIIYLIIKNSGKTPAYDVYHSPGFYFGEYPLSKSLAQISQIPKSKNICSIPPNGTLSRRKYMEQPLAKEELENLKAGKIAIYLYGRIRYKDAFGKRHFTNYRAMYNGLVGTIGRDTEMAMCDEGNEAD